MKLILEELDRQSGELARIAREIDAARGSESRVELEVGRFLQQSMEEVYEAWDGDAPPGWPDDVVKMVTRVGAQRQCLLFLAETFDALGGEGIKNKVDGWLTSGREAMPTALAVKYHEAPLIYLPDAMEHEFSELIFEDHDRALLFLRDQLDRLQ